MNRLSILRLVAVLAAVVLTASNAPAVSLLSPGDPIIAIDLDSCLSNYPGAEGPGNILDGLSGSKYLNYGEENSGFIVTPGPSLVQSFVITTANDAPERDPSSWALYGTDDVISSTDNSHGDAENWMLIDSGPVWLPPDRYTVGPVVTVGNLDIYASYRMVFPTVVDPVAANSMQIADMGFFESTDGSGTNVLDILDPILAIDLDVSETSSYPPTEPPANAIDGTLAKYLNFGRVNSGFIVTPSVGASIVTSFQITTANDYPERDPASWELLGTNDPITSADNSHGDAENWILIDSGTVDLPEERYTLGPVVPVDGSLFYDSYRMVFTGLRNPLERDAMQIAEIQFEGRLIPEPSAVVLLASGLLVLGLVGWRRLRNG